MKLILLLWLVCLVSSDHPHTDGGSLESTGDHTFPHDHEEHMTWQRKYDFTKEDDLDLDSEEDLGGRGDKGMDEEDEEEEDLEEDRRGITEVDERETRIKYSDDYLEDDVYDDDEGEEDTDDDPEDEDEDEGTTGEERFKRKVIFGGGGGYSGVQHRRGGGGGDPYGRRRDHHNYHGPDYGNYGGGGGGWPYGRGEYVDTSSFDKATTNAPETTTEEAQSSTTNTRGHRNRSYGIIRTSPSDRSAPSTSGRRSKTGRRETKRKLSKSLKFEIAQYALEHGTRQAVRHYSQQMGKRISEKKIDKFIRRYQQRQERLETRQN